VTPDRKPLAVYLNDHLAGSVTAIGIVGRASRTHAGSELGAFLRELGEEIEADRQTLRGILDAIGARPQRSKLAAAWAAEKASRLKPHGRLLRRSPLTPFLELETLALGIHGKLLLWRALRAAVGEHAPGGASLDALIARAEEQHAAVERHRVEAARSALA